MAKKAAAKKTIPKAPASPSPPVTLTMRLFGPGMSLLHRAGLGGLACSLKYIERAYDSGDLSDDEVPGGPWTGGQPPWTIEPSSITLNFGPAEAASEFLKRLFALSFKVIDLGVIYLPGQFTSKPSMDVLAELQNALTLTFIQHGKTRTLAKEPTVVQCDPDGDGKKMIPIEFKACTWFKHQDGWQSLIDNKGRLTTKTVEVIGPLSPGAVVRHNAFNSITKIEDPVERALPLYFAIAGCLVLSINSGCGVLVVPEVEDLEAFSVLRPLMSPTSSRQCRITSAGDAALQAQLRLRLSKMGTQFKLPGCHAITFRPTPWASQQKSRVDTLFVPPGDETCLRQFAVAMQELQPRVVDAVRKESVGRGKNKVETQHIEYFWSDSIVRPLVADNLARGQPWYRGFVNLMTKLDPVSKKPLRLKLVFEKEGLKAMTQKIAWQDQGESAVVSAVHESLRRRFGAIASENKGKTGTMKNRMSNEFDKWRLAFAGAKTADQFRHSLCDLFARSGMNSVLREKWESVLPWLSASQWQLTRDLALLALASYAGTGAKEIDAAEPDAVVPQADVS
jgi:CRISPR-associated protein Cas8a1/Csx13